MRLTPRAVSVAGEFEIVRDKMEDFFMGTRG